MRLRKVYLADLPSGDWSGPYATAAEAREIAVLYGGGVSEAVPA